MNWDRIEGNWKQVKGKVQEKWGKLTDDDMDVIAGKSEQLAGRLQERYGYSKEKADEEVTTWAGSARDDWFTNTSDYRPRDRV